MALSSSRPLALAEKRIEKVSQELLSSVSLTNQIIIAFSSYYFCIKFFTYTCAMEKYLRETGRTWKNILPDSFYLFYLFFYNFYGSIINSLAMSRKSIPVSNLGKLQLELLDCVGIVKDEISNILVLLQQFIDKSGPEVD